MKGFETIRVGGVRLLVRSEGDQGFLVYNASHNAGTLLSPTELLLVVDVSEGADIRGRDEYPRVQRLLRPLAIEI